MKAIVAMDPNRVIGYKGKMPWHFSEDLKWFKEFTMGKVVLMGRKTYESLGMTLLPGRSLMILSNTLPSSHIATEERKYDDEGPFAFFVKTGRISRKWVIKDISEITDGKLCKREDIIVAGGRTLYEMFLPEITEIYVTHVIDEFEGDTYMPEFERFLLNSEVIKETKDFWIVKYWKNVI